VPHRPYREPEKFKTVFASMNLSLPDWKPNESFANKVNEKKKKPEFQKKFGTI
jgi:hypothetical protein